MKIFGQHYQTIWETDPQLNSISIIDQRLLPHKLQIVELKILPDFVAAIKEMMVRGAPLIGVVSAYGLYFATKNVEEKQFEGAFSDAVNQLLSTRPTAVNLRNSIELCKKKLQNCSNSDDKTKVLLETARKMLSDDVEICKKIGLHGSKLLGKIFEQKGDTVNVLTHCNAGWLATIDYGTALAPIYFAKEKGIPIHVWVDETRPRLQGAKLTAFELLHEEVPHTIICDNSAGLLMQKGLVDIVIVGTDRTTRKGDVANKIGTYLKALSAFDNKIPFYVALPSSSIDWGIEDAFQEIPLEIRSENEVKFVAGKLGNEVVEVLVSPEQSTALNYAFDITPARLISGFITERGICKADEESLLSLFPEMKI